MKNKFRTLALIVTISGLAACDTSDDGATYSCSTDGCVEDANGSFASLEDCQSGCNLGDGLTDVDGNTYTTIIIGDQEWVQANLNVAAYRNGDPIPQVQDLATWQDLTTGAWCFYENNTANGPIYGRLYNWYAVNDPRGLACGE
ncbi:MAG: fibrobacter succinogenes major paralogous domain-containing protein [Flavobacteriales bacterium]|nr:fibrobacter succinogenes major paralogous domain-containing protein [Flavobacteriales bacterium]